jgi:hypothetical protein
MRFYLFMRPSLYVSCLRALPAALMVWLAVVVLALGLVSCGGGVSGGGTGGGGSTTPLTGAGPANNFGAVSGLGSIFVGDYEFDDALDKVTAQDGLPVSEGDLGLGVQVSVLSATASQALALNANNPTRSIQIKRMFMGILTPSSSDSNQLMLNGQAVFLDRRTVVLGATNTDELLDTMVQIAGYLEPTLNYIVATRIEPASAQQIAQNQIYLSARVQSVDVGGSSVSVGFATVSLASLKVDEPLQVNDIIRVQGTLGGKSGGDVTAVKLTKLKPVAGEGELTYRGTVNTRPTDTNPDTALVVDGYEVQLTEAARDKLRNVRRGSVVQIHGQQVGLVIKEATLTMLSNPQVTLPGEDVATWSEPANRGAAPRPDYRIYKSPVQIVNEDGSFVVRGLRVRLVVPDGVPVPVVMVGQIISVTGQIATDTDGLYIRGKLVTES